MSNGPERHDGGGDVAKSGGSPVKEGPAALPETDDAPERGGTPDSHGGRGDDWRDTDRKRPQSS